MTQAMSMIIDFFGIEELFKKIVVQLEPPKHSERKNV